MAKVIEILLIIGTSYLFGYAIGYHHCFIYLKKELQKAKDDKRD